MIINNIKKEKYEKLEPVIIKELSKNKYEFYKVTFNRIMQKKEMYDITLSNIYSAWQVMKLNMDKILLNYPNLTKEERNILITKSKAFSINRSGEKKLENSRKKISNEEKELLLLFIIENEHKPLKNIFEEAEPVLGRSSSTLKAIWTKDLRQNYTKFLSDPKDISAIEAKITQRKQVFEHQNLQARHIVRVNNKEEVIAIDEKNKNTHKGDDKMNKKFHQQNKKEVTEAKYQNTESESNNNSKTKKVVTSDFIFRKINDDEFEVVKGPVIVNANFVSKKLREEHAVSVIDKNGNIVAKNFLS